MVTQQKAPPMKPSEKAMRLEDGFYLRYCDGADDGMEGFHYFTIRSGKVLPSLPVDVINKAELHITRQATANLTKQRDMAVEALELAQCVLGSLVNADTIKQTTVVFAYAQVREAELKARETLAAIATQEKAE